MHGVRVTPIALIIVVLFFIFILVSNFATNYINLNYNRLIMVRLLKKALVKDLKELYTFSNNQFEINQLLPNEAKLIDEIGRLGREMLGGKYSLNIGVYPDGKIAFQSSELKNFKMFPPYKEIETQQQKEKEKRGQSSGEGYLNFEFQGRSYFGVYKYQPSWGFYILRAEEESEFYAETREAFWKISIIILILSLVCTFIGIVVLKHRLRFVSKITRALMDMEKNQQLRFIDLKSATTDQVTFLGMSFNALSSTINNLLGIFRRFVSDDLAEKIYREKSIRLEGEKKELTVLFTDIRGFTYMTETLGNDIIQILNLHYDQAIAAIIGEQGVIGSIIGDALLSIYGTFPNQEGNKSFQAVCSAYKIHETATTLRLKMHERREELIGQQGGMTEIEEALFKALLIKVGVGIDGGEVFYGNIGSVQQMTNTVIGDRVNSASRLEGLTRMYNVPIIVGEYVKNDIETNTKGHGIRFIELDRVAVKGKKEEKLIYWPILRNKITPPLRDALKRFEEAHQLYYRGRWTSANRLFKQVKLPLVEEFIRRTQKKLPKRWDGVWEMTTK